MRDTDLKECCAVLTNLRLQLNTVLSHRPVNMNQNLTACYSWYFMVWTDYMTCKDNRSHSTTVSLVSGVFQSSRFSHHTTDHWRGVTRYKTFPLRGAYENSSSTTLMLQPTTWKVSNNEYCCHYKIYPVSWSLLSGGQRAALVEQT